MIGQVFIAGSSLASSFRDATGDARCSGAHIWLTKEARSSRCLQSTAVAGKNMITGFDMATVH